MTRPAHRDLVIIGGGPAGIAAAREAARRGARVVLIESRWLGGTSLHAGSIPSKVFVQSARSLARARDAHASVARGVSQATDHARLVERTASIEARLEAPFSAERLARQGIELVMGRASFVRSGVLCAGTQSWRYGAAIIATGLRPRRPNIRGLAVLGYRTSDDVFAMPRLPERLAVIGGGPLGCEMAQVFCRLGARVTLIHDEPKFLPREERDAAQTLSRSLARDGVEIRLESHVVGARRSRRGKVLQMLRDRIRTEVEVDEILASVGRTPNVSGMGLDEVRVVHDRERGIIVDDRLRTSARNVYAAGDVCSPHRFTHVAEALGRMAASNALGHGRDRVSDLLVPRCTFTDPEIAQVGISAIDAFDARMSIETVTVMMQDVDRAITDGHEDGFVKLHVARGSDRIVGATIVASRASEMINEIVVAMQGGIGMRGLASSVHTYPAQSRAIETAARIFVDAQDRRGMLDATQAGRHGRDRAGVGHTSRASTTVRTLVARRR